MHTRKDSFVTINGAILRRKTELSDIVLFLFLARREEKKNVAG